jgi:hypothetical protein
MKKLIIVVLMAGWAALAGAADEGSNMQGNNAAVPAAAMPASAVPAAAPEMAQPAGETVPPAQQVAPKSSIPLDKRKGGDITQCLEAGSRSDKDIAACAEKYRH